MTGRCLLGPFVGEIGYELEYWIPFLRRELRRHGIERDQATVLTRGGAALWYRDFAAHAVDALELLSAEEYLPRLEERRRRAGDLKQLRWEPFDRELVDLARERLGDVDVVHPGYMFTRLRGLWFRGEPIDTLWPQVEYRLLDVEREPLAGLPADYVAVKAYFNEVLPGTEENRAFFRSVIERLAERTDVVLLSTGLLVDDHEEWATAHERVHPIEHLLRPEDNLAVQTQIIAASRGLVATYGGFSYLGSVPRRPGAGRLRGRADRSHPPRGAAACAPRRRLRARAHGRRRGLARALRVPGRDVVAERREVEADQL